VIYLLVLLPPVTLPFRNQSVRRRRATMASTLLVDRHVSYIQSLGDVRSLQTDLNFFFTFLTGERTEQRRSCLSYDRSSAPERGLLGTHCPVHHEQERCARQRGNDRFRPELLGRGSRLHFHVSLTPFTCASLTHCLQAHSEVIQTTMPTYCQP